MGGAIRVSFVQTSPSGQSCFEAAAPEAGTTRMDEKLNEIKRGEERKVDWLKVEVVVVVVVVRT